MAGNILAGFVKGFSDTTLAGMERREEEERERRKIALLEQLRRDTEKDMLLFKEDLPSAKLDRERTRQTMDLAVKESGRADERLSLDRTNIESQIASRARDDARQDRSTNAYIRSLDGAGKKSDDEAATDLDVANELMYRYKSEVATTEQSGNISGPAIRQAAIAIVENSRTGEQAQKEFLKFLDRYRTGRASTPWKTSPHRPLAD
jgi:hypothetical protein